MKSYTFILNFYPPHNWRFRETFHYYCYSTCLTIQFCWWWLCMFHYLFVRLYLPSVAMMAYNDFLFVKGKAKRVQNISVIGNMAHSFVWATYSTFPSHFLPHLTHTTPFHHLCYTDTSILQKSNASIHVMMFTLFCNTSKKAFVI